MDTVSIKGGCRTITAEAAVAHDVIFTGSGQRLLLIVTPAGELVPGPGLSASEATQEVAGKLVEYFGHGYGSALKIAADKASAAEAESRAQKRRAEQAIGENERLKKEVANLKEEVANLKAENRSLKKKDSEESAVVEPGAAA